MTREDARIAGRQAGHVNTEGMTKHRVVRYLDLESSIKPRQQLAMEWNKIKKSDGIKSNRSEVT